jgi:hypothetical protein
MDRIEARRLQPHFIESFFIGAFEGLNGQIRRRADHRYTIPHVPRVLRESRSPAGVPYPISKSYEAVTFEKQYIHVDGHINDAVLICPGHPLLSALIDEVLGKSGNLLKRGTVFIDDTDSAKQDRLLFYIEDILEDGRRDSTGRPVKASHRIHFVEIYRDGTVLSAGLAPYLDYTVPAEKEKPLIQRLLKEKAWWDHRPENLARDYAVKNLMPAHLKEIRDRRIEYVDKVEREVKNRLSAEIVYWDSQAGIMKDQIARGKPNARLNAERFQERVNDLELRQKQRLEELALERNIVPRPPVVLGGAWIVPRSMVQTPASGQDSRETTADGRDEVERIAMETVMAVERELNNTPVDVSRDNPGYDIESKTAGRVLRFIEVKGRRAGEKDVTVTHNEMRTASNSPDNCILAVVIVDGNRRTVTYYTHWIDAGPSFAEVNRQLNLNRLRQSARVALEREIEYA